MKNLLVSAAAILALSTGLSLAAVGPSFDNTPSVKVGQDGVIILAKRGGSESSGGGDGGGRGRGSDDNGGDNRGGRGGSTDDNSTSSSSSSSNNSANDVSGSGRKKPRIKGGSGCDDPGDVLEHAACR
jgi:hypothetical protein